MELGLSLGDGLKTLGFLKGNRPSDQDKKPTKIRSLDFCMALGLNPPAAAHQEPDRKTQEIGGDDDGYEDDQTSQGDDASDDNQGKNTVQINLLSLLPAVNPHRRISSQPDQSLPWSSDIGSSENSSGNMGRPAAAKGLSVHWLSAAAARTEEVSSADSDGYLFIHNEQRSSDQFEFEAAAGNDVAEAGRSSSRASDDDENGMNTRKKLRLSKQQSAFLEESFKEHNTLNPKQKLALAKQLNLRPRQVEVWFQNRRARTKLKQTEVDCEYLKRCCETLNDDNRRLHKEVQELRALKTSKSFYMQLPATTLTMCPSCENVAPASSVTTPPAAARTAAAITSPVTRPRFYPFSQTQTHPNDQHHR
ncbi:hypothetical protein OROGR_030216 [Orobanche gracilis]